MEAIIETIRVMAFGLFWLVALPAAGVVEVGLMTLDKIGRTGARRVNATA
jgi:hypothetical protein